MPQGLPALTFAPDDGVFVHVQTARKPSGGPLKRYAAGAFLVKKRQKKQRPAGMLAKTAQPDREWSIGMLPHPDGQRID